MKCCFSSQQNFIYFSLNFYTKKKNGYSVIELNECVRRHFKKLSSFFGSLVEKQMLQIVSSEFGDYKLFLFLFDTIKEQK